MKDISIYFKHTVISSSDCKGDLRNSALVYDDGGFPEIENKGVALIYVPENRKSPY